MLSRFRIRPDKKLGQNFLLSDDVLDEIIAASELKKSDTVLEIGPGLGVLTHRLAREAGTVIAVEKDKNIYVDTSDIASQIEEVYEKYLEGDLDFFALSENYARGFYEFLEQLKPLPKNIKFVKAQITGPISYALFLTDQNKKAIIYDKDLFEVLTKILVMKARWQIRRLKEVHSNIIIFIDH